jgi:hypothetical protein
MDQSHEERGKTKKKVKFYVNVNSNNNGLIKVRNMLNWRKSLESS